MSKKLIAIIAAAVLLLGGGYILWDRLASPTDIALVNMSGSFASPLTKSNTNPAVKYHILSTEEFLKHTGGYDLVFLNGMGLHIDEEQQEGFRKYTDAGHPIMTLMSTNPDYDYCNLDSLQIDRIEDYYYNANRQNHESLANYIRKYVDKKKTSLVEPAEIAETPYDVLYHLDETVQIKTVKDFEKYLKEKGYYFEGRPKVVLAGALSAPYSGNRANLDATIQSLIDRKLNVYPLYSSGDELIAFLREIRPDVIIHQAHGRMFFGRLAEQHIRDLQSFDSPVYNPLSMQTTTEEWLDDALGMVGGYMSQSIVMPELDGGIVPYALNFLRQEEDGAIETYAEPTRLEHFADMIARMTDLKTKPNRDKKIAIFYYSGPGQEGLTAAGLETIPALYNTLARLKKEGYTIDLPQSPEALGQLLLRHSTLIRPDVDKSKGLIHYPAQAYEQALEKRLDPYLRKALEEKFGPAPGTLQTGKDADGEYIKVSAIDLGHVVLMPQPAAGVSGDDFEIAHGTQEVPPHFYVAAYLWAEEVYGADALIHFGTHGSLEFTPRKQVALSSRDWPEALIGTTPHFYYYTIADVGEAIIAKRRSYATILSHLTPPFEESDARSTYDQLMRSITEYEKSPSDRLALQVKREAVTLGLHRDLKLDSVLSKPYTEEEIHRLEHFAEEVANEKIYTSLYTTGVPYTEAQLRQTVVAMCSDPIAYSKASLDRLKGTDVPEGRAFTLKYLDPSKALIRRVLDGYTPDSTFVASYGGFTMKEYREADEDDDEAADETRIKHLAIINLSQAILTIRDCYTALKMSPERELDQLTRALHGGYITPTSGGDPITNSSTLPTGNNLYSINPERTPSEVAWERGKKLADQTLEDYRKRHGKYPEKISFTFWSGEYIETEGVTLAQVLYLLGVEPIRDRMGRVSDVRLIPSEELGRPRVDVLVQTSGQFRDVAASRLDLITKAVVLAASAEEGEKYPNYVHEGSVRIEQRLVESGLSPAEAREWAGNRVFGGLNGMYGTSIQGMIFASDRWSDRSEIAETYLHNMGAAYGSTEKWGEYRDGLFRAAVEHTDVVIQPRQSNTWGALSLDHVFEFMGGLNVTIASVTGKEPEAYLADYRNHSNMRMQELKESIGVESRTTLLNPSFAKRVVADGGTSNAGRIAALVENTFGWEVTKPDVIDDEMWDGIYDMWVRDTDHLGTRQYIERVSPASMQEITGVMLESARKGMWSATPEQVAHLADVNAQLTTEYGIAGGSMADQNGQLRDFIRQRLTPDAAKAYDRAVMTSKAQSSTGKSVVLKEEGKAPQSRMQSPFGPTSTIRTLLYIGGALLIVLVLCIVVIRKKHRA